MDPVWYIKVKGKKYGPFSGAKLDTLLQAGKIAADTPACRGGSQEWSTIGALHSAPACTPEHVNGPEPAPAAVQETSATEKTSTGSTHYASSILLGAATVVGVVIYWLDLYLPALKLSLSVVTAASIALVLRFLTILAFSRMQSDSGRNRRLVQLMLIALSAGSLLGGLNWYEGSAAAGAKALSAFGNEVQQGPLRKVAQPSRHPRSAGPTFEQIAEQTKQEFLGQILQGAVEEQAFRNRPCPACGGSGSYSYVDGSGRLQLQYCPHCYGSGKKGATMYGR